MKIKITFTLITVAILALTSVFITLQQDQEQKTKVLEQSEVGLSQEGKDSPKQNSEQNQENDKQEGKIVFNKKSIKKNFPDGNQELSSNLSFSLTPVDSKNKKFNYEVKNESEKSIEIEFSTSQRYEVVLEKKGEGEIYRFSKGRAFMQVLGELGLKSGESKEFEISLPELQPGNYTLTVFLVGKDVAEPSKRTINLKIND